MAAVVGDAFLSKLEAATSRYEQRAGERKRVKEILGRDGILHADASLRVTKRLERLNGDWALAKALEATPRGAAVGRSLGDALRPESFGADVLGLERLMGRNDLVDVGFLEAGHLASRSVGRITVSGGDAHYGTGFLVSPRLLLTNNHVLGSAEEAGRGYVEFNYQAGLDGRALSPVTFALAPTSFFETHAELDFTLVAVEEHSSDGAELSPFGWLSLIEAEGKVLVGELVNIIQHPNGEPKQLALRENQVVDMLELFVHYETDTEPGSSGSPVFNDQWEVLALHHSGVPQTDGQGNYLTTDGSVWTPDMGEHRLAWKANEGVRISRVLREVRERPLTGAAAQLRAQLIEGASALAPAKPSVPVEGSPAPHPAPGSSFTAHLGVPLRVTVSLEGPSASVSSPPGPSPDTPSSMPSAGAQSGEDPDLRAALVDLEAARARPYYDEPADREARERYYGGLETSDGAGLREALADLLERTHEPRPSYKPMRLVYPWLDLHPDGLLRSIYSAKTFAPEELIRADAGVEAARTRRFEEMVRRESALGPAQLEAQFDALEAALPYNCEHVVPQSWFAKDEPMRGDLHHLFACESGCNSFRGNFPYFDFADPEEAVRQECGRREPQGFEPAAGKGPVARATLYFLLRYPRLVGDAERELPRERLELLLVWHEQDPVSDYERHRNFAAAELQGNRNPLIDHPEWARRVDLRETWA